MSKQTPKVNARRAAEIHAGVERIYAEGKEQEQDTGASRLRQQYWKEWGKPHEGPEEDDRGGPAYVPWLEAKLEAVIHIMDQPWNDSHDRGREEAFKRLAKIRMALNLNSDPVTEDTPQRSI